MPPFFEWDLVPVYAPETTDPRAGYGPCRGEEPEHEGWPEEDALDLLNLHLEVEGA
jgi:hypothetical protein